MTVCCVFQQVANEFFMKFYTGVESSPLANHSDFGGGLVQDLYPGFLNPDPYGYVVFTRWQHHLQQQFVLFLGRVTS